MAGFGLDDYEQRIPCPFCGSTDCAGIRTTPTGKQHLICIKTKRHVTAWRLRQSAIEHGMTRKPEEAKV